MFTGAQEITVALNASVRPMYVRGRERNLPKIQDPATWVKFLGY